MHRKKIIISPDSFKGSLSSIEVTSILKRELKILWPEAEILGIPLADGGEGTAKVLKSVFPIIETVRSQDPLGRPITSRYLIDESRKKALLESAEIIGLPLLTTEERDPMKTSSFGLGVVIRSLITQGFHEIIVTLGGSATSDGGTGMLRALGYRFLDRYGHELKGDAADLNSIDSIDIKEVLPGLEKVKFMAVTDVRNPLTGENGAAKIFGPQKGADPQMVARLEEGLQNLVKVASALDLKSINDAKEEGSGAAGGLGFAFKYFLNANLIMGCDYIFDILDYAEKIKGANLIITGEGKIDNQSLMGKVLSGVLSKAKILNIPVVALGGKIEDTPEILAAGCTAVYEIADPNLDLVANMTPINAERNLVCAIRKISCAESFMPLKY